MIKGATVKDLYFDIEATAWEYAYQSVKHLPRLITIDDILKHKDSRDALFMDHYGKALKTLRQSKGVR